MAQRPVRVAVVGVGHVGAVHAQIYRRLRGVELVAVCDVNLKRAKEIARTLRCEALAHTAALIGRVDAASVCVPTSLHHAVGKPLLQGGLHLLIEKPLATTLQDADELIALARRRRLILQVGHVERFNAAVHAARAYLTHPRFIEAHRLSPYPFRGTDVSVVMDVMIHDLDLVLALVRAQPTRIDAVGVAVLSPSEDIANVRLRFASGCVANLTASRISDEAIRRIRLFQENCYLSINYKDQTVELARKTGRTIRRTTLAVTPRPPLEEEVRAFLHAVRTNRPPRLPAPRHQSGQAGVSAEDARAALALALKIERVMRTTQSIVHRP